MSDNVEITAGTGVPIATDEIGGIQHQRVKLQVGADGTAADVCTAEPLPISDAGGSLTVDGAVAVSTQTTGGATLKRVISAASTNATVVKAGVGQVYGWSITNAGAATRYVKLYNKTTAPTVGTDVPVMTIPIGAAATVAFSTDVGIAFATGIGLAITKGLPDANTEAVALEEIVAHLLFK